MEPSRSCWTSRTSCCRTWRPGSWCRWSPKKTWAAACLSRLNAIATVERVEHVLVSQEMAAVPVTMLGEPVASLAARRVDLIAALDVLFTGV